MKYAHVLVEFKGGDYDGRIWDNQSNDSVELEMLRDFLFFTDEGAVGRGFPTIPMNLYESLRRKEISIAEIKRSPTQKGVHVYRVRERVEIGDALLVRLAYSASMNSPQYPSESLSKEHRADGLT